MLPPQPCCPLLAPSLLLSLFFSAPCLFRQRLSRMLGSNWHWQDLRSVAIAWPLSYESPEEKEAFLAAKPFTYIGSLLVR